MCLWSPKISLSACHDVSCDVCTGVKGAAAILTDRLSAPLFKLTHARAQLWNDVPRDTRRVLYTFFPFKCASPPKSVLLSCLGVAVECVCRPPCCTVSVTSGSRVVLFSFFDRFLIDGYYCRLDGQIYSNDGQKARWTGRKAKGAISKICTVFES